MVNTFIIINVINVSLVLFLNQELLNVRLSKQEHIQKLDPVLVLNAHMGLILKKVIVNVLNALKGNIIPKENDIIAMQDFIL